jgi:hypothetical protein
MFFKLIPWSEEYTTIAGNSRFSFASALFIANLMKKKINVDLIIKSGVYIFLTYL